jgi:hypothetical protein
MCDGAEATLWAHVGVLVCAAQLLKHGQFFQLGIRNGNSVEKRNAGRAGTTTPTTQLLWCEQAASVIVVGAGNKR